MANRGKKPPPIYSEIADIIGVELTNRLCKQYGGCKVTIPVDISDDHWLSLAIGLAPASELCAAFSVKYCTQIIVPKWPLSFREKRRQLVDEMVSNGAKVNEIALALDVSYSTAEYHIRRARERLSKEG